MIPPFKWLYTFMNDYQEWHAFVIGLADGITFQATNWFDIDKLYGKEEKMSQEYHYYKGGQIFGRLGIIGFISAMIAIIIGVIP